MSISKHWRTSKRELDCSGRPLVMGILNVTPDSFSDGGSFLTVDDALRHAEAIVNGGADILDIGGESTRPNSTQIPANEELDRVIPVIVAISKRFDLPISIDTTKSQVAQHAVDAGAEIINDISGLRFDDRIAKIAADSGAGLILMHSRGEFENMHTQPPVDDILVEISAGLRHAIESARTHGVSDAQIVLDVGIGFGKTQEQNLELLANLEKITLEFKEYPMLVGASRKSFLRRILGEIEPEERLGGSLAAAVIAAQNGANILRVHDVGATVQAIRVMSAIRDKSVERDQSSGAY